MPRGILTRSQCRLHGDTIVKLKGIGVFSAAKISEGIMYTEKLSKRIWCIWVRANSLWRDMFEDELDSRQRESDHQGPHLPFILNIG